MKGDNGELLVSEEQVSDRWREYFEKLLNERMSGMMSCQLNMLKGQLI